MKRSITFLVMFYCILGGNYNLQSYLQSWVFSKVGDDMTQRCEGDTGLRCSTCYRGKSFQPAAHFYLIPDSQTHLPHRQPVGRGCRGKGAMVSAQPCDALGPPSKEGLGLQE